MNRGHHQEAVFGDGTDWQYLHVLLQHTLALFLLRQTYPQHQLLELPPEVPAAE